MKTSLVSLLLGTILIGVGVTGFSLRSAFIVDPATPRGNAHGTQMLSRLPIAFVPNLGQWGGTARYVARVGAMTVFLEDQGWSFTLVERTSTGRKESREPRSDDTAARGVTVRMTFAGAQEPEIVAEQQLPGRHNYFLGNDATKWRSDVALYGAVRYREMQPGIDVRAREQHGRFEYDLLLQPSAELDRVEIAVEGIDRMHLDGVGALVLETRLGPVRMPAPPSWEEGPSGERSLVTCDYVLRGKDRFGFEVAGRRPAWALVVDPGIMWSTFLGGTGNDVALALAVDTQGAVTVAGQTFSFGFPTAPGSFNTTYNGSSDAFVTRLSPTGSTLVYSTFLGGMGWDYSTSLALDVQGACTVAGPTDSADFPTTPGAFDTTLNGNSDAFVTRLTPTGSTLVYSTFLGGMNDDYPQALALDTQGAATVTGWTDSASFPTTAGAFDTTHNGNSDAFATRLSPTGSTVAYSTFLGATGNDVAFALALDTQGAATVTGWTDSANFPTTPGAFDTSYNGNFDAFVSKLSPMGSSLVYSTFLGGTGTDRARDLAFDTQGAVTVVGWTGSSDFPTTPGAFDTTGNGNDDAFVTRVSPTGSSLVYSTYLGGTSSDGADALALDALGAVTVAGRTDSANFPTTPGAFDTSYNGGDVFVTRLSWTGSTLVYSTFLGGISGDYATALAVDGQGACTVTGSTNSTNFPTTPAAFDLSYNGNDDTFVTRLDMLPTGVSAYGTSTPGCTGPLPIGVSSWPQVGNANFALTCGNAATNTLGLIAFAAAGLPTPLPVLGVDVWIDPAVLLVTATVFSNPIGASEVPLPIPANPAVAGVRLFTQFLWLGPTAPLPCPPLGFSASNALDFTIQP